MATVQTLHITPPSDLTMALACSRRLLVLDKHFSVSALWPSSLFLLVLPDCMCLWPAATDSPAAVLWVWSPKRFLRSGSAFSTRTSTWIGKSTTQAVLHLSCQKGMKTNGGGCQAYFQKVVGSTVKMKRQVCRSRSWEERFWRENQRCFYVCHPCA